MGDTKNVRIISIEGNIGSGKSTFLKNLQEHYSKESNDNVIFVDEPVDEWNDICDNENETILSKFYKDSEKYSFPFQMMAFITRYNKLKKAMEYAKQIIDKNPIIITERSLYTDKYVFAKMLYDEETMGQMEYFIYNKWFSNYSMNIDKIVDVKTSVENCSKRITSRNREGEDKIEENYLKNLDIYHNTWINGCEDKLVIDGDVNFINNKNIQDSYIKSISDFITQ